MGRLSIYECFALHWARSVAVVREQDEARAASLIGCARGTRRGGGESARRPPLATYTPCEHSGPVWLARAALTDPHRPLSSPPLPLAAPAGLLSASRSPTTSRRRAVCTRPSSPWPTATPTWRASARTASSTTTSSSRSRPRSRRCARPPSSRSPYTSHAARGEPVSQEQARRDASGMPWARRSLTSGLRRQPSSTSTSSSRRHRLSFSNPCTSSEHTIADTAHFCSPLAGYRPPVRARGVRPCVPPAHGEHVRHRARGAPQGQVDQAQRGAQLSLSSADKLCSGADADPLLLTSIFPRSSSPLTSRFASRGLFSLSTPDDLRTLAYTLPSSCRRPRRPHLPRHRSRPRRLAAPSLLSSSPRSRADDPHPPPRFGPSALHLCAGHALPQAVHQGGRGRGGGPLCVRPRNARVKRALSV